MRRPRRRKPLEPAWVRIVASILSVLLACQAFTLPFALFSSSDPARAASCGLMFALAAVPAWALAYLPFVLNRSLLDEAVGPPALAVRGVLSGLAGGAITVLLWLPFPLLVLPGAIIVGLAGAIGGLSGALYRPLGRVLVRGIAR